MVNIDLWAIKELASWLRIDRSSVVPFIGAGVSRSLGFPSWSELAEQILETTENLAVLSAQDVAVLHSQSPLSVLSACRRALGDTAFHRQVASKLRQHDSRISLIAQLCWLLNPSLIVTTNLDSVIEHAHPGSGNESPISLTAKDAIGPRFHRGGSAVLHLHGILNRFETWIMSEDDYAFALDPLGSNGAILQSLLLNRVLLFVGFSCNDVDFNFFVESVASKMPKGSMELFALVPRLTSQERKRLNDLSIYPIEYVPAINPEPEIVGFLKNLLLHFDPLSAESSLNSLQALSDTQSLVAPSELRGMSSAKRRDILDVEFKGLYSKYANASLDDTSSLPAAVAQRRSDVLDMLGAAWQVGVQPPHNGIYGREVIKSIGRGGFGEVFLTVDIKTGERQALKVAHLQETSNMKFVSRFKQGIRAMRRLSVRGVKNITRVIEDREVPLCLFMDYYEGGDLGELIRDSNYEYSERLRLAAEIAEIIAEAHGIPVYHRDLKPSNVLIDYRDDALPHAILTDFDLAWFEGALSKTTTRIGDHTFASPEQLRDVRGVLEVRAPSDVYSLGMITYFLARRGFPPPGQWMNVNLEEEVFKSIERQCSWQSGAAQLAKIVKECANENPDLRPTARNVADRLRALSAAEQSGESVDLFVSEINYRVSAQHPLVAGGEQGVYVELKRAGRADIVQVSFSRHRDVTDSWGNFSQQATKYVGGLQKKLEDLGFRLQSKTANSQSGRLVMQKEVVSWSAESAIEFAANIGQGVSFWANWT